MIDRKEAVKFLKAAQADGIFHSVSAASHLTAWPRLPVAWLWKEDSTLRREDPTPIKIGSVV